MNSSPLTSTTSSEIIQELPGEVRNLVIDVINGPGASILQGQLKPLQDELQMATMEGRQQFISLTSKLEHSILTTKPLQREITSQGHMIQQKFDEVMFRVEEKASHEHVIQAINGHTTNTLRDVLHGTQNSPYILGSYSVRLKEPDSREVLEVNISGNRLRY